MRPPRIASTAKGVDALQHHNQATEKISNSFERFNPYAQRALELDDDADVHAMLAIAFEVSQLRYQLSPKHVDKVNTKAHPIAA